MNVGSADSAPRPEPILEHRTADVEAGVVVTIRAVTLAGDAAKLQRRRRRDIRTLQCLILEVDAAVAVHGVRPLLEDEIQLDAGRGVLCVGPSGRDGHLLEHVEVEVDVGEDPVDPMSVIGTPSMLQVLSVTCAPLAMYTDC